VSTRLTKLSDVAESKTPVRAIVTVARVLGKPLFDSNTIGASWPVFLTKPVVGTSAAFSAVQNSQDGEKEWSKHRIFN
jgi:hypothetical protein